MRLHTCCLLALLMLSAMRHAAAQATRPAALRVAGLVRDSATGAPVPGATVQALRGGTPVATIATDSSGHYVLNVSRAGRYVLAVRRIGYRPTRMPVDVSLGGSTSADFLLREVATTLEAVVVTASAPVAVDVRTGDQTYHQLDGLTAPTATTSQIVQQAVAGAARAPTGEVHIRGQHGEFTYYVDGVPVAAGISGSFNELFDPAVADRIDFETGGWDAEYGNKNIAVVKVQTRRLDGGPHLQLSGYAGSFGSNGQTFLGSTHVGSLGLMLSATHQASDMRREPLMQDPRTGAPLNFHNRGTDDFLFGKMQYAFSSRDEATLEVNASRTGFQVPFDSTGGFTEDDRQQDMNGFVNLSFGHRLATRGLTEPDSSEGAAPKTGEVLAAAYLRRSTLTYTPGRSDQPVFLFYPDSVDRYTVSENRSATTAGVKLDYALPLGRLLSVKTGVEGAIVTGREHFESRDSTSRLGPSVNSPVHGGDVGAYVQTMLAPSRQWEIRAGLRLDHHLAPLAGDQHQVSPRLRIGFFPSPRTSFWVYYGRLFIPSNVEDFHVLAAAGQGGATGVPTVPERDHYFEAGAVHRFAGGVTVKFAGYYRDDAPAVDDNTLPGTALTTTVNIAKVHVAGLEGAVEFHPEGPFSGYVNAALSHASAHGPITGGFLPTAYPQGWFDQDHDQRLSVVASGEYRLGAGYVSATGIFGSGLTNGHPEAAPNLTGLFDFNSRVKVAPSFIVNLAGGTQFTFGRTSVRPELYVNNLFNLHYVLKGAFTSGPSIGRPREIELRVTLGH